MKKSFAITLAAAAVVLAGCAKTEIRTEVPERVSDVIGFNVGQSNITKAQALNASGHYNFGVFAYKSTEAVNPVMENYLVGFSDETEKLGYKFNGQSTVGDVAGNEDGKSMWQYEGLGNAEYNYSGDEGFYKVTDTKYMSNIATQYLRYWDKAAATTSFYAYSPYINGAGTATFDNATKKLSIPDGTIIAGYNDVSLSEYMYAKAEVAKADYGHDVPLNFTRLNSKVDIKFWEDIPGYSVRILDLGNSFTGVQATPSIIDAQYGKYGYKMGLLYSATGATIDFSAATASVSQLAGTTTAAPVVFAAPVDAKIGENRYSASKSATTYYAIPKGQTNIASAPTGIDKTGLTFHVSYELTSDTGERIVVRDATVHVPYQYANWKANTHYTYIFKITANSNGTTDPSVESSIDPTTDPEVPTDLGLYPIVFDNCTVSDWEEADYEYNITDGVAAKYHDIQLSQYSIVTGTINVTITDNDTYSGHAIKWDNVTVTPADANVVWDNATQKITVSAGAAAGIYTVTYKCPATAELNHPATWTEKFYVGSAYTVALSQNVAGTNALADSKIGVVAKQDGTVVTPAAGQLTIDYPANFTDTQKQSVTVGSDNNILVKKEAAAGVYKLVYKVNDGVEVKVAEALLTVADYNFYLDQSVVSMGATPVVVNAVVPTTGVISMTSATGITLDNSAKTITVENTATAGNYVIAYTVFDGTDAKVVYNKTLTVKNSYAVTLNKNTIDRDLAGDKITITTFTNGVADSAADATLVVKDANDAVVSTGVTISSKVLTVSATLAAGNYKVVYTPVAGTSVEAAFVVTE